MWLVTRHGFFNIVQSDDDEQKGLLTVKARRIEDIECMRILLGAHTHGPIETSYVNDYHFRLKADAKAVGVLIGKLVADIDYPRTKPVLHKSRSGIYYRVWEVLTALQYQKE